MNTQNTIQTNELALVLVQMSLCTAYGGASVVLVRRCRQKAESNTVVHSIIVDDDGDPPTSVKIWNLLVPSSDIYIRTAVLLWTSVLKDQLDSKGKPNFYEGDFSAWIRGKWYGGSKLHDRKGDVKGDSEDTGVGSAPEYQCQDTDTSEAKHG
ncbi:hypothetical protein F4604DRAFT_1673848 [Suillus subluteus]|nr:hypothetical protein F4604DRAFT_1673848 [Suillus subluteus]